MYTQTLNNILDKRTLFLTEQKAKSKHIFLDMIETENAFSSDNERIIMFMLFSINQEFLIAAITKNKPLCEHYIDEYNSLKGHLSSKKSILMMQSIEYPMIALYKYRFGFFREAENLLDKSINIYYKLFNQKVFLSVYAVLEQSLNIARIYLAENKYEAAEDKIITIVNEFSNFELNDLKLITKGMQQYLIHEDIKEKYMALNHLIDSYYSSISKKEGTLFKELFTSFLNKLKNTKAYSHIDRFANLYTLDKSLTSAINNNYIHMRIPSSIEAVFFDRIKKEINDTKNHELINTFLEKNYNYKLA